MGPKRTPTAEEVEDIKKSLDFIMEEISTIRLQQKNIIEIVEEAVTADSNEEPGELDISSTEQQVAAFLRSKGIALDCNSVEACHPLPRRNGNIPAIILRCTFDAYRKYARDSSTAGRKCVNSQTDAVEGLAEQLGPTSLMGIQNRMALDMLLAEKGGVCAMFGDLCCTFIPNNTAPDGTIIRILREQVESHASRNELGVDDDTLQQWAEETDQTDGSLGALQARVEELVVIIRVRTQSLYRQNDSNKRRHRIHKVILDEKKRLAAAVDDYNKLAEPTKQIVSSDALMQTDVWPWQSTSEPAADLRTKRKVFEKVMAVRRLREEEMILCREMQHHWTVLRMRSVVLGTISSDFFTASLVGMSEDAQKGLHSLV
ncbi:uncharacterized protein LOC120728626 [Simochromis diagramma]|uniref:uncharacterized protein LOC120728626 n=1 Tax=Simochromis diagramma TaxID=43689 RepID=UPI001A7EC3F1|nr:uncharacterized protein LOC120728626 [Simochromis diagramma]